MAKSISNSIASRQQRRLKFIDLLAEGADDNTSSKPLKLSTVEDALFELATLYIVEATNNLTKLNKVHAGGLIDSITLSDVVILGSKYSLNINLASYYKFVDQGVKGWADEKGGNSPYQFKNYTGKAPGKGKMVTAIRQWLIKEGLQGKASGIKKTISKRERHQRSISDVSLGAAISITKSIRKKGLKPTRFWSDAERKVTQLAKDKLGTAVKIDIINNL